MWSGHNVLSQSIKGCKSELQRHSKEAEIKSAFPPISMKTETQHQEAGNIHIHNVSHGLTHPELLAPATLTLTVRLGASQRF